MSDGNTSANVVINGCMDIDAEHRDKALLECAELMADTSGGPNVMKARGPAVADALRGETVPGTFDIDSIRKDMRTMLEEAEARGVELPLVAPELDAIGHRRSAPAFDT